MSAAASLVGILALARSPKSFKDTEDDSLLPDRNLSGYNSRAAPQCSRRPSQMKRTCIICGEATGSREHTFPAALGGRRTNKGIYCETHNGDYSPLAKVLSSQLKAINAMLGVRGDHDNHPHTVVTTDSTSAEQVTLTKGAVEFTNPEVVARSVEDNVKKLTVRYSKDWQLQKWIAEERARGHAVGRQGG